MVKMKRKDIFWAGILVLLTTASMTMGEEVKKSAFPAETNAISEKEIAKAQELINGGIVYLLSQQNEDGGWSIKGAFEPAVSALAIRALLQHPDFTANTPVVQKGLARMLTYQQDDGGIYNPREGKGNYCTSIAVYALAAAQDPKYKPNMDCAVAYLRKIQIVPGSVSPDGKKIADNHPYVGGVSYGSEHGRPDLNNLGWWVAAMNSAQVPSDDPAMQRAAAFVSRCQNRSESNTLAWAQDGPNDGGFIYAPAKRDVSVGESKAGPGLGGRGLRSYGSITYVGFLSLLYAGIDKDDPRVKAAYAWFANNWTLNANPNMPTATDQQGLYFYYNAFARALRAFGRDEIQTPSGEKHNWRAELINALAERVNPDGSWVNKAESRWSEGNSVLTTCYEILALEEALKK